MFEEKDIQFLDNTAKSFLNIVKKIVKGWAYSKAEVDSAVSTGTEGLYSIRGSYDISGGSFPTTGGRGVGGLPKAGDGWNISVGGTAAGVVFSAGDNIVALIDTPGQTAANWQKGEGNLGFTPENSANKENSALDTSTSKYPTNRLVKESVDSVSSSLSSHTSNTSNPHSVTKSQVGLGNADNTSDANKPVSTAQQTALDLKLDKNILPAATPATPASGANLFVSNSNSDIRAWLSFINSLGAKYDLQPLLNSGQFSAWLVPGGGTAVNGIGITAATVGPVTRTPANTNMATANKRVGLVSSAGAGSSALVRNGLNTYSIGNSSFKTGFYFTIKFTIADSIATGRLFAGLTTNSGAIGDVDPATLTNSIGVAALANDTNLKICYGGSAAQTPIDLGANFPANSNTTDVYEFTLYAPSNGTVIYRLRRLNTGHEVFGLLNGTLGTVLPDYNTLMSVQMYRSNGGTASAAAVDLYEMILQTLF